MKKTLLTLLTAFLCVCAYGQTEIGFNGGKDPSKAVQVGGIGADGKFHFFLTENDGRLDVNVSGAITNNASVTSAPGATPSPSPAMAVAVQGPGGTANAANPILTLPKQYTGVPSTFTPATADATVFTLAAGEIGFIQNLSADAPLAVKKGASASTTSFNFILAAGAATDDGKGGAVRIDDWVGAVSVAKMTGTARYIAWKQAP